MIGASGRTVVIIALRDKEAQVRDLVTCLKLFVPGHSTREQVIPWRETQALRLSGQ